MKQGIDISYHQGSIDFDLVKKDGIDFVIIREGYRDTVDSRFFEYVNAARAAELEILGCYHFSYALNVKEVIEEAIFMIKNMKEAGLGPETLCFFDLEYDSVKKAAAKGVDLGVREINEHAVQFCNTILSNGYKAGIYMNMDYYDNIYLPEIRSKYLRWIADYRMVPTVDSLIRQYTDKGKVNGIPSLVDMDYYYGDEFKMEEKPMKSRKAVVDLVTSWLGKNEADGSHKSIIDIYNSYSPLPRGVKMEYSWAWCACTWSALAIALGYTDIMPLEISCGLLIDKAKEMGCWVEDDSYVPKPADGVLYDWDDNGVGDNTGWPDHVGVVTYVNYGAGYFEVIEGNCADVVKKRTMPINGRYIRGFITPKYDVFSDDGIIYPLNPGKSIDEVAHEIIIGKWGNNPTRKELLKAKGYDYEAVRARVNELLNGSATKPPYQDNQPIEDLKRVTATTYAKFKDYNIAGVHITTADLYCRDGAGTNKKALCVIPKGTVVNCYGYNSISDGTIWPLISVRLGDTVYEGFCSIRYLKRN